MLFKDTKAANRPKTSPRSSNAPQKKLVTLTPNPTLPSYARHNKISSGLVGIVSSEPDQSFEDEEDPFTRLVAASTPLAESRIDGEESNFICCDMSPRNLELSSDHLLLIGAGGTEQESKKSFKAKSKV